MGIIKRVVLLRFKDQEMPEAFTSLEALLQKYSKEEIGVGPSVIRRKNLDEGYENDLVIIKRVSCLSASDIKV